MGCGLGWWQVVKIVCISRHYGLVFGAYVCLAILRRSCYATGATEDFKEPVGGRQGHDAVLDGGGVEGFDVARQLPYLRGLDAKYGDFCREFLG